MQRPFTCSSLLAGPCGTYPVCCLFSRRCAQQMKIESPPGSFIGSVVQKMNFVQPFYEVVDSMGKAKYCIYGSVFNFSCFSCCCCNVQYEITTIDKKILIGIIIKEWQRSAGDHKVKESYSVSCE
ncbi:unnamed protein product [Thelazia callipaeda]|uniref:Phospholipid scramblase n=1 Tax=Thelazia callipaeda TaxID=103827 RepID=A0A0N5CS35_THECL|nr:unnamed protein product [Thelazia callipaeda]